MFQSPFDLDLITFPRRRLFRDPFAPLIGGNMFGDMESDFRQLRNQPYQEYSHSFSSIQDGDRYASKKTIRMKDAEGREEVVEERCLDGNKVVTRTTHAPQLEGGQQQLLQGQQLPQQQQQQQSQQIQGKTGQQIVQAETTGISQSDFDRMWESDEFVRKWFAQQPASGQKIQQEQPMYKRQQEHLAQLGIPPSSTTEYLLQQFRGNVERVAYVMLLLKNLKERGCQDEAVCVQALLRNGCDVERAHQEIISGSQSATAPGVGVQQQVGKPEKQMHEKQVHEKQHQQQQQQQKQQQAATAK